ncbi:MAG: hypothetical protein OXG08_01690 [Gammaproteobacteria bacterium]|nr:hypothetical protein [Gammaproteobacteria bacterium]
MNFAIKKSLLVFAALMLVFGSFALGFYFQSNTDDTAKNIQPVSSPSRTTTDSQAQASPREALLSFAELSDPSRYKSRIARTSAMVRRLANADASTIRDFLDQSRDLPIGSWQTELQNAIIQRLAVLRPMEALSEATAFGQSRQQELLPIVFSSGHFPIWTKPLTMRRIWT